jgi:hypothetical protein
MHRTVWFAFCCLVAGFGALVSIKAIATPSLFAVATNFPDAPRTRLGPDGSLTPNRAAKSDRLPIPDMRAPTNTFTPQVATATTPVVPVERAPPPNIPAEPARTNADDARQMAAWTVAHQRWRKANAELIAAPPQQRLARKQRPTAEADNRTGKVIINTLPCRQDAVGGLLRALDLSPRCGS